MVCDRYDHSSIAYQSLTGGGTEAIAWLREINRHARRPDLTIVLDVPPEVAAERRRRRRGSGEIFDADELQAQLCEFYRRARALSSRTSASCTSIRSARIEDVAARVLAPCADAARPGVSAPPTCANWTLRAQGAHTKRVPMLRRSRDRVLARMRSLAIGCAGSASGRVEHAKAEQAPPQPPAEPRPRRAPCSRAERAARAARRSRRRRFRTKRRPRRLQRRTAGAIARGRASDALPSELEAGDIPRPTLLAVLAGGVGRFLQNVRARAAARPRAFRRLARGRAVRAAAPELKQRSVLREGDTVCASTASRSSGRSSSRTYGTAWRPRASSCCRSRARGKQQRSALPHRRLTRTAQRASSSTRMPISPSISTSSPRATTRPAIETRRARRWRARCSALPRARAPTARRAAA